MKKNSSIILIIIATVFIFGFLAWLGQSNSRQNKPSSDFSSKSPDKIFFADSYFYDFGTISMAAGKVSHVFKIKNISDETIKTKRLYTSCMCTKATFSKSGEKSGPFDMPGHSFIPPLKKIINPDEEFEVIVEFDPAAHGPAGIGPIEREIYLENDSALPLVLKIAAIVKP